MNSVSPTEGSTDGLKPSEKTKIFREAMTARFRGELKQALRLLNRAIELNPHDSSYLELCAYVLFENGQADQAFLRFKEAIEVDRSLKQLAVWHVGNHLKRDPQLAIFVRSVLSSKDLDDFLRRMSQARLLRRETPSQQEAPDNALQMISGGRLISPDWLPITRQDTVITDFMSNGRAFYSQFPYSDHVITYMPEGPPIRVDKAFLIGGMHNNYYHWMLDYLPRLRYAAALTSSEDYVFLTIEKLHPFQRETLELAGISEDRILKVPHKSLIECSVLVAPPLAVNDQTKEVAPDAIEWLNKLCLGASAPSVQPRRRLYLSRSDATYRRIINDDEVVGLLCGYEFEPVNAASLSVVKQAELLREAQIVVAPHGAALTNTVFCLPGTAVIEILPVGPNGSGPGYYSGLAKSVGIRWQALRVRQSILGEDFHLDCAQLEEALANALKELESASERQ